MNGMKHNPALQELARLTLARLEQAPSSPEKQAILSAMSHCVRSAKSIAEYGKPGETSAMFLLALKCAVDSLESLQ